MNMAIVEDEKTWQARIRKMAEDELEYLLDELDLYGSGDDLLRSGKIYEAVLMDVELPGKHNGFETVQLYRKIAPDCRVIILTTHTEMFPEGFKISAMRFIAKDRMEEDLPEALNELRFILDEGNLPQLHAVGEGPVCRKEKNICYAEAVPHGSMLHEKTGTIRISETLATLEEMLDRNTFCRCHNGYIVNLGYVRKMSGKEILMEDGTVIPLAQKRAAEARMRFSAYKFTRASG